MRRGRPGTTRRTRSASWTSCCARPVPRPRSARVIARSCDHPFGGSTTNSERPILISTHYTRFQGLRGMGEQFQAHDGSDLIQAELSADAPAVAGWVGFVFVSGGLAVVPWTAYLAFTLPRSSQASHYRLAWGGFDLLFAFTLLRVGWTPARGPTPNDPGETPPTSARTPPLLRA